MSMHLNSEFKIYDTPSSRDNQNTTKNHICSSSSSISSSNSSSNYYLMNEINTIILHNRKQKVIFLAILICRQ